MAAAVLNRSRVSVEWPPFDRDHKVTRLSTQTTRVWPRPAVAHFSRSPTLCTLPIVAVTQSVISFYKWIRNGSNVISSPKAKSSNSWICSVGFSLRLAFCRCVIFRDATSRKKTFAFHSAKVWGKKRSSRQKSRKKKSNENNVTGDEEQLHFCKHCPSFLLPLEIYLPDVNRQYSFSLSALR